MERNRNDRLEELLAESWTAYNQLHDRDFIVRPAIPIVYFGDSRRYFESPLRVVTVGLNPSNAEFSSHDAFVRFPRARLLAADPHLYDRSTHRYALDEYFRTGNSYDRWFSSFEWVLKGLGSSYYGGAESTTLHTDICSPFATVPTWSHLSGEQESLLGRDGVKMWHSLIEAIAPNIILVSVAHRYLRRIAFSGPEEWEVISTLTVNRKVPYVITGRFLRIASFARTLLVFATAAQTPLGTVSKDAKMDFGAAIKEFYCARAR